MSINIFDPIEVVTNSNSSTRIPNLEELMIYVNLKAFRRGSTEIIFNADGFVNVNSTSDMEVNLMGKNPTTKQFTTDWSNNFVLNDDNYEGFGITDIKITTNSSYIPQVTVEFVDVRGLNFLYRGENSPYSVLYDFPPPIFELLIKGYYGKPLKYSLHLTKQNTRFDSTTGNYYITVDFIANTFAPLTDILFKYVEMFPLLHEEEQDVDLSPNSQPKTTYELINKLQNLYQQIDKNIKASNEFKLYGRISEDMNKLKNYAMYLNGKGFIESTYHESINFYKKIFDKENNEIYKLERIKNINEYASNIQGTSSTAVLSIDESKLLIVFMSEALSNFKDYTVRNNIIERSKNVGIDITDSDIKKLIVNTESFNELFSTRLGINIPSYNAFDITNIYQKIYKKYYSLKTERNNQFELINNKIEERVRENLGFRPTVRNIIEVICNDVDRMFETLSKTHLEAKLHHKTYFDQINRGDKSRYVDVEDVNFVNSFPLFIEEKTSINSCKTTKRRIYPKNKFFSDIPFPETQLVDDFINVFLDVKRSRTPLNIKMATNNDGNIVWIPITPLDSNLNPEASNYASPYFRYQTNGPQIINNIINVLLDRFLVLSQYSFYNKFFNEKNDDYINLYAKSEALNLVTSLKDSKSIDGMIELLENGFDNKLKELSNKKQITNNVKLDTQDFIIDKTNPNYKGLFILNENQVDKRIAGGTTPIDEFMNDENDKFLYKLFGKQYTNYSKENILIKEDGQNYLNNLITLFNIYLNEKNPLYKGGEIYNFINNNKITNPLLGNFLIYSMFGRLYLPSNYKMIAIHKYPSSYIKSIKIYCNLTESQIAILKPFILSINMEFRESVNLMFSQLDDIRNNISNNDRNTLNLHYNLSNDNIVNEFMKIFYDDGKIRENIEKLLNKNSDFTDKFTEINYLVVNSENTFNNFGMVEYESYSQMMGDSNKKDIINKFFTTFKAKLKSELIAKKKEFEKEEKEFFDSIDDDDIKTQTYYSIKNIVDKWVRGFEKSNGYPFNIDDNGRLIDKFVFVDRAMNDIGDSSIIDARTLIDMRDDIDINVFTVISRLLSQNGFEFFPLQNFMNFENNQWEDSFKIYNNVTSDVTSSPAFVCMYIGGTSSTLATNNSYIDDGLMRLEEAEDFNSEGCGDGDTYLVDGETMPSLNVKYGEVNAFRVRYGKQNQSMFENIEINSREFPETNESLAILSNLAKDESNSTPIPKAQNLYNLYENRAYSTKITMLGNAMIQPTHYFELENIPLFSGSYVVLNVEHVIRPNHMKTTFNGVRILRYPNPIVDNFAESIGMLLGISTSDEDVFGGRETEDRIISIDSNNIPIQARYNSMHPNNDKTLQI